MSEAHLPPKRHKTVRYLIRVLRGERYPVLEELTRQMPHFWRKEGSGAIGS